MANGTEWGSEPLDRPYVYLASSIDDVVKYVDELAKRPTELGAVLSQIAV